MTSMQNLTTLIQSVGLELTRFESKPTKTGATRIRASLLQIKKLADSMRKDILEESRKIEVKPRGATVKKVEVVDDPVPEVLPERQDSPPLGEVAAAAVEKKVKKTRASKKK
jgi:hypothetical protein